MRQVCFTNSEFINYVNENMVVVYGFGWSGRNLIIDGEKVDLTEGYTPFEPDEEIKNVVPFAVPLVAKKLSGKLKDKYYLKDIYEEILAAGVQATEYAVLDCNGNQLIEWEKIRDATAAGMKPEIFLDFFRDANDQLRQKNEEQLTGSDWRKGYWNLVQSEYYLKEKEMEKSVNMLVEVLDGDKVLEKYKKDAVKLQEKMDTKITAYIESFSKKLKDEKKREKYILFMRVVYTHFEKFEDVTDKIKEVCKEYKISKEELLGTKDEEEPDDENEE